MGRALKGLRPSIRVKLPAKLEYQTAVHIYKAYSSWIQGIYPEVISKCPVFRGAKDDRREPSGFLRSSLKLVISKGSHDIPYYTITVPNAKKGTKNYRALMALYSMHEGRSHFTISPKGGKKFLTFPVGDSWRKRALLSHGPGRKTGPKNWAIIPRAVQSHYLSGKQNPFIYNVAKHRHKELGFFLRREMDGTKVSWKKKVIRYEFG